MASNSRPPAGRLSTRASKLLDGAVDYFKHGRWLYVMSTSRLAIEAICSAEGTVQKQAKAAAAVYMKDDERKKISKSDRGLFIQEAPCHFAHLAHHVEADRRSEYFSHSDAADVLGLTSAALSDAAAREPAQPET